MKRIILMLLASVPIFANAQKEIETDTLNSNIAKLDDVVVYANKFPELARRVAQTVKVTKEKATLNYQASMADVLINSGNLFVQKSQQGGGSPVIRGFEASRVLLMVDGIRMNNAIYRAGHLQNIVTIDNMSLDRVEVLYGPSSTLYGSDALGGVINMYTKTPIVATNQKVAINGNAIARYATATEEARTHIDFNIANKQWASLTSVTLSSFGNVTQGSKRSSDYPNFGKKNFYVARYNNNDSAFINENPNKQIASGYKQIDIVQKVLFQPRANIQHIVNLQLSNTNDIPRYDRLTETAGANPSYAEWNYGPQMRAMVAYQFSANKMAGFFEELKFNLNYQDIAESRITRRFKNNNRDSRWERVNVFGVNIDAKHYSGKNELHIGAESYINYVRSTAERKNIATGVLSKIATRYADGPTKMNFNAIYAQHTFKINDRLTLNDGLRLNAVRLDARFIDTGLLHLPFVNAIQNNLAVTGNIGVVYATPKKLRLAAIFSSGFRSPNVDDLTKVFDTKSGYVVVPNKDIKPEYTYNAEVNFAHSIKSFSYGGSLFYTWFTNAIVVDKHNFNGETKLLYEGVLSDVYAPQNKAKAYLYGFNVYANSNIVKYFVAEVSYNYTYGRYTNATAKMPLDHVPPTYGKIAVAYNKGNCFVQAYSLFNGWKKISDYNLNGEDNEQYATKDGMPSWITLNLQSSWQIHKYLYLNVTLENVLDKNYRYFASGISASGRNVAITLKANF